MLRAWASDAFASVPRLLAKNEILQKESTMSAEEVKDCTYQESDGICHARGAIAFRLWRATFHLVEITSGHNFGEGQYGVLTRHERRPGY